MAEGDNKPIVIRKRRKGHGGHGHHGGAWKVAYADFVTAMMAFFLLLWLLSSATDEQKKGIADYFAPASIASSGESGSGGLLGGETITSDGAMVSNRTPFGVTVTLPADDFQTSATIEETTEGEEIPTVEEYADSEEAAIDEKGRLAEVAPGDQERALADGTEAGVGRGERAESGPDGELTAPGRLSDAEFARLAEEQAEKDFKEAVEQLREAVQSVPELAGLADNLLMDRTAEGMRLQIVDQQGTSMFESGSAVPSEATRKLFQMISQTLAKLPNRIAIKGHTDSVPYRGDGGYTNWELSSDRALASRRSLIESGLDPERVADVVGKAATDPLMTDDPEAPQNRRISIILLNEPKLASAQGAPARPASASSAPAAEGRDEAPPAAPPAAAPAAPSTGVPAATPAGAPAVLDEGAEGRPAAMPSFHAPAAPAAGANERPAHIEAGPGASPAADLARR